MIRTALEWLGFGEHGHDAPAHGHEHHHDHGDGGHGHTHGVIDPTIATTESGIRAIKWSFVILAITAAMQMVVVAISGSVALLADTIHNVGDAATAIPLLVAFLFARRRPTEQYTYGYGRVEDLAGVMIVGLILASALVAGYQAIERLINPREISFLGAVAGAGIIGFIGNEIVAVFRIRVGRQIESAALIADGYHARVDGLTSLAVVAGAIGVWLGFPLADPVVGLIITVAILAIVWQSGRAVFSRMLDGVEPGILAMLRHAAGHVAGVRGLDNVRARWVGHRLHAEADLLIDPALAVGEGTAMAARVRQSAMDHLPALGALRLGFPGGNGPSPNDDHGHGHAHSGEHHSHDPLI